MRFKAWKFTVIGVLVVILILLWVFVIGISSNQPGSFYNKGHNAVWLEREWSQERNISQEIQDLVNNFKAHDIDTVFIHAGPLNETGGIDEERYGDLAAFLDEAKRIDESIQYQAWLGQLRHKIDLDDPIVRHEVAKTAFTLADVAGFDGVHFDIEPVWDGDLAFVETVREAREMMSKDKVISVALAEFIPKSLVWFMGGVREIENYNSEVNYQNLAEIADQIVVMVYDTSIKHGWVYRWLVKEQTIRLTSLLDKSEVFVGIPSYEERSAAFNPDVENVENAILGVVDGLNNLRSEVENFAGLAIYRYGEMDEGEWEVFDNLWLR